MSFGVNIKTILDIPELYTSSKSLGKDIMLLCKGWYNKEKYKTLKDALVEYYHRNYRCEDIQLDFNDINQILLKPSVQELLTDRYQRLFIHCMFETEASDLWKFDEKHMFTKTLGYEEELYYRMTKFLNKLQVSNGDGYIYIDTSSYWVKENGFVKKEDGHAILEEPIID